MADSNYPVRSYADPSVSILTENSNTTQRIIYPTRNTVFTSDLLARFVRIRPPLNSGDGQLTLRQIAVFDISGFNISVNNETYATSSMSGAGEPNIVVNGTISAAIMATDNTVNGGSSTTTNTLMNVLMAAGEIIYIFSVESRFSNSLNNIDSNIIYKEVLKGYVIISINCFA
jgi:hypothetical protein